MTLSSEEKLDWVTPGITLLIGGETDGKPPFPVEFSGLTTGVIGNDGPS
jgi:hypothetical protein